MQTFYNVVLYFFMFGVFGWICECLYCSWNEKKFVNRGFLNGPICPIYSFGGLIVVYILAPVRDNVLLLFLLGMICCTALEYVVSVLLEKLFHTSWWDYSNFPLNFQGRVCLLFSLVFGTLSVIGVNWLYPPFSEFVGWIPKAVKPWLVWGLLAIFTADGVITVHAILSLNGKLAEITRMIQELRQRLETAPEDMAASFSERLEQFRAGRKEQSAQSNKALESLVERFDSFRENFGKRFQHRRLMDAFPNMKPTRNQEGFSELKEAFAAFKEKRLQKKIEKTKKDIDKA